MSHVDGIMALRQLFSLFRCPFIRICLSLYYPRRSLVPRISMILPLSEGFGPCKKAIDVFLAGLSKLCEDISDVFLGIGLVQPRHPYDHHEGPGGLGSLL